MVKIRLSLRFHHEKSSVARWATAAVMTKMRLRPTIVATT